MYRYRICLEVCSFVNKSNIKLMADCPATCHQKAKVKIWLSGRWERVTFVCVCASMLSISLSCVHSQLWLVPIPSIPSITLTIISTPAASLLQPAVISTTQAAHGPLAHPCPFQTGPIPQVRDEDQTQMLQAFQELASGNGEGLALYRNFQCYLFIITFLWWFQICFCKINCIFLPTYSVQGVILVKRRGNLNCISFSSSNKPSTLTLSLFATSFFFFLINSTIWKGSVFRVAFRNQWLP